MKAATVNEMLRQVEAETGHKLVESGEHLVVFALEDEASIAFESMDQALNDWNNNEWF